MKGGMRDTAGRYTFLRAFFFSLILSKKDFADGDVVVAGVSLKTKKTKLKHTPSTLKRVLCGKCVCETNTVL
jgi:hypothetical protein